VTPAEEPGEEPGGRREDPAVARLLRWYPRAWRERYGEEWGWPGSAWGTARRRTPS
jgi:hypothetical protein